MRVRPWICISTMSAVSMLAVCTTSFAGDSNCCFANGGVGCDDATCQATVCGVDSFCCNVAWDSICAGEAASLCGDLCGGGGSNCCVAHAGVGCDDAACQTAVCAVDSFCCNVAWDSICSGEAATLCGDLCGGGGNPACPGTGDCCSANGGLGCNDEACCNTVCTADSFCCNVAWDGICASEAASLCGDLCEGGGNPNCPGAGDCCFPNGGLGCNDENCCNTVCTLDSFCCNVAWDSICASEAASQCGDLCVGIDPCANPNAGDCCAANGGIGCNDAECCAQVCAIDSFCCQVAWDGICASEAISMCTVCEGFGCGGPSTGSCCEAQATPFCNDEACCNLVCAIDSFCCAVAWDAICADEASGLCEVCGGGPCEFSCPKDGQAENEECGGDTNGGCNTTSSGGSSCCVASGGLGCDDPDCQAAVCAIDSFCCNVAWDGICAAEAASLCAKLCPPPVPAYEPITPGVAKCGTYFADGSFRDTDWYSFDVTGTAQNVTVSVFANFPTAVALIDDNCPPGIFVFVTDTTPCPAEASFCLGVGTYTAFVAPSVFNGAPCGSGFNDYVVTVEFVSECEPLSTCCFASGGLGCDDPACQEAVCAIDSFCCQVAWDGICAAEAASLCEICAVPAPANDECENASAIFAGVTAYSTAGATTSEPPLDPACEKGFGLAFVDDIWFTYVAEATGTVTVSTCNAVNYDSRLAAYAACGDELVIACNDDAVSGLCGLTSEMSFDTVCNTKYIIRVGGFGGEGSGNLTITQTGLPCAPCIGDINGDGVVDATDLGILLGGWGFPGPSDLNGDGTTDAIDLGILLGAWGPCP